MKKFILMILPLFLTGCISSKELIESVESPNGDYVINTYLENCGATCDFGVSAEVCDLRNKCEEIYYCYHESTSFVYWIDGENVSINNKELNIFDDEYYSTEYDDAFLRPINESHVAYLIDKNDIEYSLSKEQKTYIIDESSSMFIFDEDNIYDDYDYKLIVKDNTTYIKNEYNVIVEDDSIILVDQNKMNVLNRTDYEYFKKILSSINE